MKITIKINGAEVILEAQKPDEVAALGPLAASILEHSAAAPPKRTRPKAYTESGADSELAQARIKEIEWVLSTSQTPLNAPEVCAEVKTLPSFYTKGGDPIHIVRRVLSEGVQEGVFQKTISGLFTMPEDKETIHRNYSSPIEDDMSDPFADN